MLCLLLIHKQNCNQNRISFHISFLYVSLQHFLALCTVNLCIIFITRIVALSWYFSISAYLNEMAFDLCGRCTKRGCCWLQGLGLLMSRLNSGHCVVVQSMTHLHQEMATSAVSVHWCLVTAVCVNLSTYVHHLPEKVMQLSNKITSDMNWILDRFWLSWSLSCKTHFGENYWVMNCSE